MAAFRGSIQGQRGETSRLGSKSIGIRSWLNSWKYAIDSWLFEDDGAEILALDINHYQSGKRIFSERINLDKLASGQATLIYKEES